MSLVSLLIVLLIFCLFVWAARAIMAAFGVGDPIATIVYVIIVIFVIAWLAQSIGLVSGGPMLRLK